MFIDFHRGPTSTSLAPAIIIGEPVTVVQQYKYLGTILTFDANTDFICKKANQRLFFLRKLRSFNVDKSLLKVFYTSCIESVLTFAMICWFGNLSVKNTCWEKL